MSSFDYYKIGYTAGIYSRSFRPEWLESLSEENKKEVTRGFEDGKYDWEHLFDQEPSETGV